MLLELFYIIEQIAILMLKINFKTLRRNSLYFHQVKNVTIFIEKDKK